MTDQTKEAEVNWDELRPQLIRICLEIGPLLTQVAPFVWLHVMPLVPAFCLSSIAARLW